MSRVKISLPFLAGNIFIFVLTFQAFLGGGCGTMGTGFRYQKETVMEVDTRGQEKAVGVRVRFLGSVGGSVAKPLGPVDSE